ncbi:rxt2-like protein [Ophiostoma piceae UAMH 11346]|uniref:Rxt2-like protein n=1 Tax=Ophiostoma piceae (strain UAMH 11346) TaxID=1262450 RepID=S3BTU3_OPHP1|nr:rxt2-like protein [Ophiostoma piceae UAMH 11346]
MAARDQAIFLEMAVGIQRARKRKQYDSDSDSDIDHSTNRGNKLKRDARFVREGQLGAADGLNVFAETIDYNGYRREIISRNPPLLDAEGYEIDSDEDDDAAVQEAVAAAADDNPYAGIQLERLLAPLASVTDLASHPMLSLPFKNKALTELTGQGASWMHKENHALWKVKPLLIKLCGDHIWVDSGLMVTPNDADLFNDAFVARLAATQGVTLPNGADTAAAPHTHEKNGDTDMVDADKAATNGTSIKEEATKSGSSKVTETNTATAENEAAKGTTGGEEDAEEGFIHPLYLAPRSAHPEPNLGLPEAEADDLRRMLQMWVQKQEEVARGTRKLHEGLLRAERMRKTVMRWAKAEAHSGPNRDLSDGEDYYDREEWGLDEDLKKGHDEEEEDVQVQQQKKTRNRK